MIPQFGYVPVAPMPFWRSRNSLEVDRYLTAAVERTPRVFGINQIQQRQFLGVRAQFRPAAGRVDRGTGNARQFALPTQRQRVLLVDPALAVV